MEMAHLPSKTRMKPPRMSGFLNLSGESFSQKDISAKIVEMMQQMPEVNAGEELGCDLI